MKRPAAKSDDSRTFCAPAMEMRKSGRDTKDERKREEKKEYP